MRAFNAAAVAALKAHMDRAHEAGKVPSNPVTAYAVVSVTSPRYSNVRNDATPGGKGFRIVVQYVGKTADELGWAVDKGEAAYMGGKRLTVPGYDVTPVDADEVLSGPVVRDPDAGGLLTCTVLYPFAAYPTD